MHFICVLKVNVQICQETCCVALTLENSALAAGTKYLVGRMLYVNPQTHHMAPYVSNLSHISSMFLTPEQWFFLWQIFTISRKRIYCHKFHDFKENPKKKFKQIAPIGHNMKGCLRFSTFIF